MFLFADRVLPETNQRQNSFRNQIKGKPAQTFYRPDHQWIFGTSSRIYNYTFFDLTRMSSPISRCSNSIPPLSA